MIFGLVILRAYFIFVFYHHKVLNCGAIFSGSPYGESNYKEGVEFDPLKHHNSFCPWVNENVAAAGCFSSSTSAAGAIALCGWQLTLDALDTFQSLGHIPAQPVESELAAFLYKDEHRTSGRKLIAQYSFSKRHGDS